MNSISAVILLCTVTFWGFVSRCSELGEKFDIRKFHDAVLEEGPLPLDILQSHVREWIARQK